MRAIWGWLKSYVIAAFAAAVTLSLSSLLISVADDGLASIFRWSTAIALPAIAFILIFLNALPFAFVFAALPEALGFIPGRLTFACFGAVAAFVTSNFMEMTLLVQTPVHEWGSVFDVIWREEFKTTGLVFIPAGLVGGYVLGQLRNRS